MILYAPKRVIDLDDFLPVDGEDRVRLVYDGGTLCLEIYYQVAEASDEHKKVIEFVRADYFLKSLFPGKSLFQSQQEMDISLLNSLIEYEKSDWISTIYVDSEAQRRKHYRIILHSVGIVLDVACESVRLY